MIRKRQRFFLYFFSGILAVSLLSVILLPSLIRWRLTTIPGYKVDFQTLEIRIFGVSEITGITLTGEAADISVEYLKFKIGLVPSLLIGKLSLRDVLLYRPQIIFKKAGRGNLKLNAEMIGLKVTDGVFRYFEGILEDINIEGDIDLQKLECDIKSMSCLVNIERAFRDMRVVSSHFRMCPQNKGGIFISGHAETKNSEADFSGKIEKGYDLKLKSKKIDLAEFSYHILMDDKRSITGFACGEFSVLRTKEDLVVKGSGTSDALVLYELKFNNADVDFLFSLAERGVSIDVKSAEYCKGTLHGRARYLIKGDLNAFGYINNFDLSVFLDTDITGSRVNGAVAISGIALKDMVDIEIKGESITGMLLEFPLEGNGSRFVTRIRNDKMESGKFRIFSKLGFFEFSGAGSIINDTYVFNVGEGRFHVPDFPDTDLFFTAAVNFKNDVLTADIDPVKAVFLKDVFTESIPLKGYMKLEFGRNDRAGTMDILAEEFLIHFRSRRYRTQGIRVNGRYRNGYASGDIASVSNGPGNDIKGSFIYDKILNVELGGSMLLSKVVRDGFVDDIPLSLSMNMAEDFSLDMATNGIRIEGENFLDTGTLRIRASGEDWEIEGRSRPLSFIAAQRDGGLTGRFDFKDFDLSAAWDLYRKESSGFSGLLTGVMDISGTMRSPAVSSVFRIDNFAKEDVYIGLIETAIDLKESRLKIDYLRLFHKFYYIKFEGMLPISLSFSPLYIRFPDREVDLVCDIKDTDASIFNFVLYDVPNMLNIKVKKQDYFLPEKGGIKGSMALKGTYENPVLDGYLTFTDVGGRLNLKSFKTDISGLKGSIKYYNAGTENNVTFDGIRFSLEREGKKGLLEVNGNLRLEDGDIAGRGTLELKDGVLAFSETDYRIDIVGLKTVFDMDEKIIKGNIALGNSMLKFPLINVFDLILNAVEGGKRKNLAKDRITLLDEKNIKLALTLTTRSPVFFTGENQNFSVNFDSLSISGTLSDMILKGDFNVLEGNVYYLGNTFKFLPSIVSFSGSPGVNPQLKIDLQSTIKGYQINIAVTGKLKEPAVAFSSLPYLSYFEILTLVLFKSRSLENESTDIYTIGLDLLINQLTEELFKLTRKTAFGYLTSMLFDTMKIERISTNISNELVSRWKFTVGKYVYPNLYVGYSRYQESLYDQQMEFKFFVNPQLVLSVNLNMSPYETRSFGDSIYITWIRDFELTKILKFK